jgi:hypothetical protein
MDEIPGAPPDAQYGRQKGKLTICQILRRRGLGGNLLLIQRAEENSGDRTDADHWPAQLQEPFSGTGSRRWRVFQDDLEQTRTMAS